MTASTSLDQMPSQTNLSHSDINSRFPVYEKAEYTLHVTVFEQKKRKELAGSSSFVTKRWTQILTSMKMDSNPQETRRNY
jgi:hypothetical protein